MTRSTLRSLLAAAAMCFSPSVLAQTADKPSGPPTAEKTPEHHRYTSATHENGISSIADLMAKWLRTEDLGDPWRPPTSGPFVTFTAPIVDKGNLVIQPLFFYNFVRGTFDENSNFHSLPGSDMRQAAVMSLFTQYGILRDTELDAQINFLHQRAKVDGQRASSTGIGDTQIALRTLLMHETPSWHPEISVIGQIKLPTGKFEDANPRELGTDIMGTGSTDLTLGLDFTKAVKPVVLHADVWYTWPVANRIDGEHVRYGDILNWNLALEIPFCKERLAYMVEFSGTHQANRRVNGRAIGGSNVNSILFGTGLEIIFRDNLQLLLGYQRTLWGTNTDAIDAIAATLVWSF